MSISNVDVQKWRDFIEVLQNNGKGVPKPFHAVETLINNYLKKELPSSILDIGCETGKNAIPLIQAGHLVTLLDIAPNAIQYTKENIQKLSLEHGVLDSINGSLETLDPKYSSFDAIIGTYAFSFIPPDLFENVMKNNVLERIKSDGYFVGGFFGDKHSWATDPTLSILTVEKIETLFTSMGFSICEQTEEIEEVGTGLDGQQTFHTIDIIARKTLTEKL